MSNTAARRDIAPTFSAVDPDVAIAAQLIERLHRSAAALVPHLARAALCLSQCEGWKHHGFANARDFTRERFDRSGRWLRNLAYLGQTLQRMPSLADSITGSDGGRPLGRTASFEISRVAQSATLETWVQRARSNDIRSLQELVRRELRASGSDTGTCTSSSSSASAGTRTNTSTCTNANVFDQERPGANRRLRVAAPAFLPPVVDDLEAVYRANNPGTARCHFIAAALAEYASAGLPLAELPQETAPGHRGVDLHGASTHRKTVPTEPSEPMTRCNQNEFLLALWAEQQVQMFLSTTVDPEDIEPSAQTAVPAAERACNAIHGALELERLITLRQDQLLLWIDNRKAWSLIGFADVGEFSRHVFDESTSTARNRIRIARSLESSPALRTAVESGRLSRERHVRIARLMRENKLTETDVQRWVDHASSITIKRLDDELRQHARNRSPKPLPMSDRKWSESRRLAPGARNLLHGL